jgi:hypothetical protein
MTATNLSRSDRLLGLAGLLALGSAGILALLHLRDLSRLQHITGIWLGLAQALEEGLFYPPLEDHGYYAGTRYLPVVFGLIAGLDRLGLGLLASAKLTALLTTLALAAGVFVATWRQSGRLGEGLFFAGLVVVLPEGFNALVSPHADALSAALAVWGLVLLDRDEEPSRGRTFLAAVLFALAFLTKLSGVAGPAAAGLWLLARGRRGQAAWVVGLSAGLGLLGLAAFHVASEGRFLDNFRSLASGGGMAAQSVLIGPARLLLALTLPEPFLVVWPVAVGVVGRRALDRTWGPWECYFVCTLLATVAIFASPGTEFNHLVELQAASAVILARRVEGEKVLLSLSRLSALAGLAWGLALILTTPDPSAIPLAQLREALPPEPRLLAEDASIPVLLGQRPVVLDPNAFRILAEQGRIDDEALAERIVRQEFDVLVMLVRFDDPWSLCPRFHFGPRVTEAMRHAYEPYRRVGRYHLYRRVGPALACPTYHRTQGTARFLRQD